jgi:hypothetical protein
MNFICHILCPQVGVPEQHPGIPMARYQGDLWDRQTQLEKPGDGFMSQVMEMQIFDANSVPQSLPCQTEGIGRDLINTL